MSHRNPKVLGEWGLDGKRAIAAESYWKQPLIWGRAAQKAGERRRVFCASLADVFEDRPELEKPRSRLWNLIETTPNLDWLLLTKRPQNVMPLLRKIVRYNWPAMGGMYTADRWLANGHLNENIWIGTSVEDQQRADERIPELLKIPAAVRFLSVEPLLGPIKLDYWVHQCMTPGCGDKIDWCIVGGESGHDARPCDLAWIRSIRDQCKAAGVSCFVKQLGTRPYYTAESGPGTRIQDFGGSIALRDSKGGDWEEWPEDLRIREFPAH